MASKSIGSIYAELTLKDKMSQQLKSARKSLNDFGKTALKGLGATAAVGFGAVGASIFKAVDAGGELNDMMARTGAGGEGLYVMQRAFENAGMAASDVPSALNKMQKALASGSDAFDKLGLSVETLKTEDPTKAFEEIALAISSIQDPAERTKAAMDIFGKSGGQMLAVLTDAGAFEQARTQVGSLGKTLADNASQLDAVGDAFGALDEKVIQIGASIATGLLPSLTGMVDRLNSADMSEFGTNIGEAAGNIGTLAEKMMEVIRLTPAFQIGNMIQSTDIPEADRKRLLEQRDKAIADYVPTTQNGTGSLASPEFQKRMDAWMTAYVESFTNKPGGEWIAPDVGIPEMLQNPDQSTYDIPSWLRRREQNPSPWSATQYSTNDFQARGLALSGSVTTSKNKVEGLISTTNELLEEMLRKREREFVYP